MKIYNKYEDHVRQRAEEFARVYNENKNRRLIDIFEAAARLSVQREAEACEAALLICGWHQHGITEYLQSLGLVPENDKPCGT